MERASRKIREIFQERITVVKGRKALDAIKARQNVRFVTFYQKKFVYSSKEAYYYGEKCSVLADIFTFAHLEYFVKNLLFAAFL